MPAAWAAVLRPDAVAAEPVASPQRPRLAVEALAVAAAQPLAVSDARPREAAGVADGSLAAAEAAAGSPAAPVPVAALAAQPTAVALPMAACGWRCRVVVPEDGLAGDLRLEACPAHQTAEPNSARRRAVLPVALQAAGGWRGREAVHHPVDGGTLAPADPVMVARCSARSRLEQCLGRCWEQRCLE
jgi:hypothetical protein